MKLYEYTERTPRHFRSYHTTKAEALGVFSACVKELKADPDHEFYAPKLTVNMIEVNTNLKAQDWVELLGSDAPGPTMLKTPVDFITSRTELKRWENRAMK